MSVDGQKWCVDVFDKFVAAGQSVSLGEAVVRKYRPVTSTSHIVLGIYASDSDQQEVDSTNLIFLTLFGT